MAVQACLRGLKEGALLPEFVSVPPLLCMYSRNYDLMPPAPLGVGETFYRLAGQVAESSPIPSQWAALDSLVCPWIAADVFSRGLSNRHPENLDFYFQRCFPSHPASSFAEQNVGNFSTVIARATTAERRLRRNIWRRDCLGALCVCMSV